MAQAESEFTLMPSIEVPFGSGLATQALILIPKSNEISEEEIFFFFIADGIVDNLGLAPGEVIAAGDVLGSTISTEVIPGYNLLLGVGFAGRSFHDDDVLQEALQILGDVFGVSL